MQGHRQPYLSRRQKERLLTILTYIGLVFVSIVVAFPFYWMLVVSVRQFELAHAPTIEFFPRSFTLDHYRYVFSNARFVQYFENSILVAGLTTLGATAISVFAGYALARFRFIGRRVFSLTLLISQMLPPILLAIPLSIFLGRIGLVDSYPGLILAYSTIALPFCSWMLRGYFAGIPIELEEAATIDGCSRVGVLYRIVLPLAAPGVAAVALFAFVQAWQEYLYALVLMSSEGMKTLTLGAATFVGDEEIAWGNMMAFATLATLPAVIFFWFLQKFLVQGLTAGAVKG